MKRKKLLRGVAIVVVLILIVVGLNFRVRRMAVAVIFVGYTNVSGTSMALFKVQNHQSRRIWLRHCEYLLGDAFQQPPGAWQCADLAASNRWSKSSMTARQYLPPEPTLTSPDPTNLMVAVPSNQRVWRIGLTVEFNIGLRQRLGDAWKTRDVKWLDSRHFINNSAEAIWVESGVISNSTKLSDTAAASPHAQP
jgi:hypothetical protein